MLAHGVAAGGRCPRPLRHGLTEAAFGGGGGGGGRRGGAAGQSAGEASPVRTVQSGSGAARRRLLLTVPLPPIGDSATASPTAVCERHYHCPAAPACLPTYCL